tara:strand:+ start:419 stop:4477 length:4059 start_codon:yes stop_codon:yes gene_type:complete
MNSFYKGNVDRIEDGVVYGWAADLKTLEPIEVSLLIGDVELGSFVANLHREDLQEANIGDGYHAFQFEISENHIADLSQGIEQGKVYSFKLVEKKSGDVFYEKDMLFPVTKSAAVELNQIGGFENVKQEPKELKDGLSDIEVFFAKAIIDKRLDEGVGEYSYFSELLIKFLIKSSLFDKSYYETQLGEKFSSLSAAIESFLDSSAVELADPHPLFSVEYYLKTNPDVKEANYNPLLHFLVFGGEEGRNPSPLFKVEYFLSQLSVAEKSAAKNNPLGYFLNSPGSAKPFALYDEKYYFSQIGEEVENALLDYLVREDNHYLSLHPLFDAYYYEEQNGKCNEPAFLNYEKEGNHWLKIHPLFNPDYYVARYPEVRDSGLGPNLHYVIVGAASLYWPNPLFWPKYIIKQLGCDNPTFDNTFAYYVSEGEKLGIKANPWFDPIYYLQQYPFVKVSHELALAHYLEHGAGSDFMPSENFFPKYLRSQHDIPPHYSALHYYMEAITGHKTCPEAAWIDDVPEYEQYELIREKLASIDLPESPQVSVVIPVYNNFSYTVRSVYSILKTQERTTYEIIIADDLSSDETESFFSQLKGIKYVRNPKNLGFLKSCNHAASKASGEYVFLLNNDTAVLDGWLDELVATFEQESGVGLVGSKLLYPNGILQEAGGILWADGAANFGKLSDPKDPEYSYLRNADYISGAAILVRMDIWNALGGFDIRYAPAYCEDSDMCLAVKNMGFKVLYQPASRVVHFEGISSGTDINSGVKKYQVVNSQKLIDKWGHLLPTFGKSGDFSRSVVNRSNKARMLIIDATFPTPDQDAGSVTIWYFLKIFNQIGYQVTFCPQNLYYFPGYVEQLNSIGVECLYSPYVRNINQYLEEHGHEFEVVMLYRVGEGGAFLEQVRKLAPKAKIIFDTVDLHFLRQEREALMETNINLRAQKNQQAAETKARELELLRSADVSIVLSDYEKTMLEKQYDIRNTAVVPLVMESPGSNTPFDQRKDIAFVGGYQHTPNIDAVFHFVEELWPAVKERLPGIKFYVIGSKPTAEILALPESDPDIIVTGFVEDLDPYMNSLRLTIAPLRYGAGIKGKIGTSLSYGVPCVASKIAAEGMGLVQGQDILMSDSGDAFIDDLVEAYQNPDLWNELSDNGLKFVEDNYSVKTIRRTLARIFNSIGVYPFSAIDPIDGEHVNYRLLEAAPTNKLLGLNNSLVTDRLVVKSIQDIVKLRIKSSTNSLTEAAANLSDNGIQIKRVNVDKNLLREELYSNLATPQQCALTIGLVGLEFKDVNFAEWDAWLETFEILCIAIDCSAYSTSDIDKLQMELHSRLTSRAIHYNISRGYQGMLGENHIAVVIGDISGK